MFKKVKPYMGKYIKYTYGALAVMFVALIASAVPFFLVYRIIKPLLEGEKLSAGYYIGHIAFIFLCLLVYAILYVLGLEFSHISAYNTLKNIRISLQKKLERQPLGTIQDMGNGRIKKLFTDDIEQVEMLLAHAIPEGISNLAMAAIAIICMFFADWKLALLSLCSLPIGMFAMGMMFKAGMERMNDYYAASAKMNATIIEYINGMEVVKVFGRDGESYQRYEKDIKSYRDFTLEWYKICWPWMALYSAILPCVALVMLPVGTLLVINGSLTLADLVLVFCLSLSVGVPILKALNFAGKFPQLNYKIDEIEKAMNSEPLKTKDNSFIGNSNIVKFEDVRFAYKEQEVLHGVSLELQEGSLTALVGESGSGKSTLAKLLVHYYDICGYANEAGRASSPPAMGFFTEGNIGRISSVLSTDMVFIEENCMMVIADMMSYLFSQAIMIIFMFAFNWRLGLVSLLFTGIIIAIGIPMQKSDLKHSDARQEASEVQTKAVLDFTEGIGIIKTYNLLGERSKELTDSFDTNCRVNLGFEEAHMPWKTSVYIVYGLATAAVLAVSAVMYRNGTLPLNYFIGMLLFLFDMFVPIRTFYDQGTRLTVMNACMDRIDALFAEKELDDSGTQTLAENNSPEIEYRNVTFAYDKKDVLKDVSFSAEKGTMTALVGPSGGGKSTIASLFARFWDIQSGEILLRGTDIRKIPLSMLMDNISMVFQRVYLFRDTVYNNIALGRPDASREEVIEAAKKARCYDFIMELPDGFDTVIGEGGASLSGGQAQRLSIARCILKNSPIVILDEATASVDADNESYIQQAISELCKGKTLLVIAHRLNTIAHADRIMVVKDGQIAEAGDHGSLRAKDGIYRSMVTKRAVSTGWKN